MMMRILSDNLFVWCTMSICSRDWPKALLVRLILPLVTFNLKAGIKKEAQPISTIDRLSLGSKKLKKALNYSINGSCGFEG
jgi:hypothetical protein